MCEPILDDEVAPEWEPTPEDLAPELLPEPDTTPLPDWPAPDEMAEVECETWTADTRVRVSDAELAEALAVQAALERDQAAAAAAYRELCRVMLHAVPCRCDGGAVRCLACRVRTWLAAGL